MQHSIYKLILIALIILCSSSRAEPASNLAPYDVTLPSALPSGQDKNDLIWFTFYPANPISKTSSPAVILLPYLGAEIDNPLHSYARYLASRGIAAAVLILPYHTRRALPGKAPWKYFVGSNVDATVQALRQSSSDVSTVATWLSQQLGIDARRIGVVGISLGAIIAHLAMGQDERIRAGVALLGGGNLAEIYQHSPAGKLLLPQRIKHLGPVEMDKLRQVDPITYANRNRPRRVLMIQAARDSFILPRTAEVLWEALGRPPIQWLDINHLGIFLAHQSVMKTTATYLQLVWSGQQFDAKAISHVHAPTIKAGFLIGLESRVTPAVQWQACSLGTRQHMALFHADIGWSGRGPFLGLAATVNAYIDVGLGRRLNGKRTRPYASVHLVF